MTFALLLLAQAVDEKAGTLSVPAVALKQDVYPQLQGAIEYALVNKGGKSYESLFQAEVDPLALADGLRKLGLKPGGRFRVRVAWKDGERDRSEPLGAFALDGEAPLGDVEWVFTDSKKGFIPELDKEGPLVLATRNLLSLHASDPSVLGKPAVELPRARVNKALLPAEGTRVTIVFAIR